MAQNTKADQQILIDARVDGGDNSVATERAINTNFNDNMNPGTFTIVNAVSTLPNSTLSAVNANLAILLRFKRVGNIVYFYGTLGNATGSSISGPFTIFNLVGEYKPEVPDNMRINVIPAASGLGVFITNDGTFTSAITFTAFMSVSINGFYFLD